MHEETRDEFWRRKQREFEIKCILQDEEIRKREATVPPPKSLAEGLELLATGKLREIDLRDIPQD